ncbi:MAG: Sua5/YciO/YrdC/YwlC family protein [Chromatiales bacterium]|nr:Sua5/YciO/YrdC/YwlC family protein [Chromatiales bacterium]
MTASRTAGPEPLHLRLAARALAAGGVIACPTEAVWGLSCDPLNPDAVDRLLAVKGRDPARGFILAAGTRAALAPFMAPLLDAAREAIDASWPGPVTWIVPAAAGVPEWLRGTNAGIAVRHSAHPAVAALTAAFGGAIVSTSANPSGRAPARTPLALRRYFGGRLDYILPGALGGNREPSRIYDALTGARLR